MSPGTWYHRNMDNHPLEATSLLSLNLTITLTLNATLTQPTVDQSFIILFMFWDSWNPVQLFFWKFFYYTWLTMIFQFLLCSKVIQLYILIFTLSSIMFHQKWSDIVPWAVQQNLIASPFQMQNFTSTNPKHPLSHTLSPFLLAITSIFSMSMSFFFFCS